MLQGEIDVEYFIISRKSSIMKNYMKKKASEKCKKIYVNRQSGYSMKCIIKRHNKCPKTFRVLKENVMNLR